ncbi:hypothetical protein ACJIZ3_010674 [Penstemon smallii]|uniref:FAD-binding PCMH-type domain-containing protein n=1 Tax=Penstemon smallii TaxID=265156 RepID=A0ABD3UH35_9LAMI
MKSPCITFLFFLLANLCSAQNNNTDFLECLTSQFQASDSTQNVIYTPQNSSYSSIFQALARNLRLISTSKERPLAIITPNNESEIQATIHCAKKYDILIRVRSGGHDYEGLSYISQTPFVIVDMGNLRSISIDTDDNTAWIQTGAILGELYYTIAKTSTTLAFTAGVCPTVGVGGHFSGGGYSMISRKHGLAVDNIIDAIVINANGEILDRNSMGDDLFWAIRGGGGTSFGIVVAFKVKLVTVPETVIVFNVARTLEQNATQLVHKWQYISDKIDENLSIRVFLKSVISRSSNRTIQASFTALFIGGGVGDLLQLMEENFPELGLVERDCIEMSWIESTLFFAGFPNGSPINILLKRPGDSYNNFKGKSDYVREPIPEHGLEGIWKYLNEEDENRPELQFSPYGGKLSTISESETPFPHRSGNIFMIHYDVVWSTDAQRHLNWIRSLYSYMTPFVSKSPRTAYLNYRDLDIGSNNNEGNTNYIQASVWGFKCFKNNFNRLVRVKTKVDPSNFFRNEQSIPVDVSYYIRKNSGILNKESFIV